MRTKRKWTWILGGCALALSSGACVGGSKETSAQDKERLKAYVTDKAPAGIQKLDVNFENKVHLIGYKFEPEVVKPGQPVKMTFYWRCDQPLDAGWMLFTHLESDGRPIANIDSVGPLREKRGAGQVLGPDQWARGKIYIDEQDIRLPEAAKGPFVQVLVGIWRGEERMRIVSGPRDNANRALAGRIRTGLISEDEMAKIPIVFVKKLAGGEHIVIDGKSDDKAWANAASTGPFVDVSTGEPNTSFPVNGSAKLLWDDTNIYVLFEVTDPDIIGYFKDPESQHTSFTTSRQPMLWTKDTVEIMVDPGPEGDNKIYYEIQINPQNRVFHTQYDTYNAPKTEPLGPFGHEDWDPKLKSAVVVRGTLDDSSDRDDGYTVEAQIPWSAFSKSPKPGDTWRMNFYAMKNNGGVAWSPILGKGNFHYASRFGRVAWVSGGADVVMSNRVHAGDGAVLPKVVPVRAKTPAQ